MAADWKTEVVCSLWYAHLQILAPYGVGKTWNHFTKIPISWMFNLLISFTFCLSRRKCKFIGSSFPGYRIEAMFFFQFRPNPKMGICNSYTLQHLAWKIYSSDPRSFYILYSRKINFGTNCLIFSSIFGSLFSGECIKFKILL